MAQITGISTNLSAFLDMLAWSEIGTELLSVSNDGYNVLVGSTIENPLLFTSYAAHPDLFNKETDSTAAGRYQLLHRYWASYCKTLGLHDFTPESQDKIAIQQIKERGAISDIEAGNIESAISKCNTIWASLAGSPYGQHTNSLGSLKGAYILAGGVLA